MPPKGAVYVSIPHDDWGQDAADGAEHLIQRRSVAAGSLSAAQLDELVGVIDAAQNPVLVLGPEVDAENGNDDAVVLADKLKAPVWIAPSASRCPFPTRHPAFRGVLSAGVGELTDALTGHDLVLVIGAPVFRYHQYVPGRYLPDGAQLVHLTSDPGEAARAPMGTAYVVGIGGALRALAGAVTDTSRPARPALPDFAEPATVEDHLSPDELFAALRTHASTDAVYVKESTSTSAVFWAQMDLAHQGSYYFPASGGLGFGLPAAVGAQLAHPNRQVIGLIGDGSANYGITALWTAARYEIPVIIVILKNGTYGALRWFADILDAGETPGLDVPGIDFVRIAEGYGVRATSVNTAKDFIAALKDALAGTRPVVIEVLTSPGGGPANAG